MVVYIGERYQLCKVIVHLADGILYEAIDISLKRDVFIYKLENKGGDAVGRCKEALGNISHFSSPRFFHMLNAGMSGNDFFVVFTSYSGMPLATYIQYHAFDVNRILSLVYEVGEAIQEALESNIIGFSVLIDNLWITDDHHILVMNYWSEDHAARYGMYGLCDLLYQLSTSHLDVPQYYEMYEHRLAVALQEWSPKKVEALLMLVQRVHLGESSLFSFMLTLREILSSSDILSKKIGVLYTPPAPKPNLELLSRVEEEIKNEEGDSHVGDGVGHVGRNKMMLILTCTAIFIFIAGGAILGVNLLSMLNDGSRAAVVTEANHRVIAGSSTTEPRIDSGSSHRSDVSSSGSEQSVVDNTSDESIFQETVRELGKKEDSNSQSVTEKPLNSNEVEMPNLVGLWKEEAEKLVLSIGLRYEYVMENTDEQDAGKVFKQDIPAEGTLKKGDKIKFYVSRSQAGT